MKTKAIYVASVLKLFENSDFFRINGCANNYKKETCPKSLTKACKK
ncbi:MAG: hypothetical protein C5S38_06285 [Candidatus Methanophagaceae archaeon]|nr:MAG: hypothetical protein C5S38_06285 [Methanophagales archaeon]